MQCKCSSGKAISNKLFALDGTDDRTTCVAYIIQCIQCK